jgi:hypothetical protein
LATIPSSGLKDKFASVFPAKAKEIKEFRAANKDVVVGSYTVDQVWLAWRALCR